MQSYDLFHAAQHYAWILELSQKLLMHEANGERFNKTEYQINTRLFNNAFCGLLKLGYPYEISEVEQIHYFIFSIDGKQYSCPLTTVSNVLRDEFDQIAPDAAAFIPQKKKEKRMKKITESKKEDSNTQSENELLKKVSKDENNSDSADHIPKTEDLSMVPDMKQQDNPEPKKSDSDKNMHTIVTKQEGDPTHNYQENPSIHGESSPQVHNKKNQKEQASGILMRNEYTDLNDISFPLSAGRKKVQNLGTEEKTNEDSFICEPKAERKEDNVSLKQIDTVKNQPPQMAEEAALNDVVSESLNIEPSNPPQMDDDFMLPPENGDEDELTVQEPVISVSQPLQERKSSTVEETSAVQSEQTEEIKEVHPLSSGQYFKPKMHPVMSEPVEEKNDTVILPETPKSAEGKRGLFKMFRREKENKHENTLEKEDEGSVTQSILPVNTTTIPSPIETVVDGTPEPEQQGVKEIYDYSQDSGQLFQHVHQVVIKPRFGEAVVSRARFIIWPTRIISMHPGNTFADFLVHITDSAGNEQILCTDNKVKQLGVTVDGKQYLVYGIWNNSVFESHVVLDGKSASMFRMEEEVQKQEPDGNYGDAFLDQFRYEHKGQPFHFIVPFLNGNRGELNIPIVGFVSIDGKKYALERCEGNTLQYRTRSNTEKIIRGHWEKGKFIFTIDDTTKLLWENSPEPMI